MNFLSTQWSTDGSTSSELMGLCITSIVKTLTDNHTLDDRNHQGHHTRYVQVLGKFWTALGWRREVVRALQWFQQDGARANPTPQPLLLSETLLSTAWFEDDNERSVTINTERYVQVLGKFWTALRRRRGVVRVLQWFQQDGAGATPLLKRIIGMATAAFPWPTDQPQV